MLENSESRCPWQSPHKQKCVDAGPDACSMFSSLKNQAVAGGFRQPGDDSDCGRFWKEQPWRRYCQRTIQVAHSLSCPLVSTIIDEIQRLTSLKTERGEFY